MNSIDLNDFKSLLASRLPSNPTSEELNRFNQLIEVSDSVIKNSEVPQKMKFFRLFVEETEEILNIRFDSDVFSHRFTKPFQWIKNVFAGILFIFVLYIVIGGILDGESRLSLTIPLAGIMMLLVVLIFLLALFEGSQMSVAILQKQELGSLRSQYPRAYSLHKKFSSVEGTKRYLAGRQLCVIIIVFIAAQITSFPSLDSWPFIDVDFPSWMNWWFTTLFLQYGILGALFVLWIGQLAPQLIATNHPLRFLNFPGVKYILQVAWFFESLGLTKPGDWLSRWVKEAGGIPVSTLEQYRQMVEEVQGYGSIGIKKIWNIRNNSATLKYENSNKFFKLGLDTIIEDSLYIKGKSILPETNCYLMRDNPSPLYHAAISKDIREIELADEWTHYVQFIKSHFGPFLPGDVVVSENTTEFRNTSNSVSTDSITILKPTKFVLFRIYIEGEPKQIGTAEIKIYRLDETFDEEPTPSHLYKVYPKRDSNGVPIIEFVAFYPLINTQYVIRWDIEY